MKRPELLLPVGNKEMCLAAIHNGADAVYIGVPDFNARGRSKDFSDSELQEMIELCHLYGVKVHLALNVLIFEHELSEVIALIIKLLELGPDAFIIQDLGLAHLIRQISPDIALHGSTQMTVTNHETIDLLKDLNIQRFVLGREVSMKEMSLIRSQTSASTELEVFVHGALCVAYSGQCFTSEGIGGRSANRGQCAQSCRLEYDLIVDGEKKELGDKRYLVSPQDLCGLQDVPQLAAIGINSFKVEGRLKSPEYVAQAAQAYDQARMKTLSLAEQKQLKEKMGITFSRGFFSGWLNGVNHQQLVEGSFSAHRGNFIGQVVGFKDKGKDKDKGKILIESTYDLQVGQGLVFVWNNKGQKGGKIAVLSKLEDKNIFLVSLWTNRTNQNLHQSKREDIPVNSQVYLNSDPQLEKQLQQSYQSREEVKRIPLRMKITGALGLALQLEISDGVRSVQVTSQSHLERAEKIDSSLTSKSLMPLLGQLSGTCFYLEECQINIGKDLFLNQKEIKELRQESTKKLMQLRKKGRVYVTLPLPTVSTEPLMRMTSRPQLHLLLREKNQVVELVHLISQEPALRQTIGDVILDYEFGKDYAPSIEALREMGLSTGIATTRILKPQEYHHLKLIEKIRPDVILLRNLGALHYFTTRYGLHADEFRLAGDFSLNVTNHETLDYLLGKGLATVCASYDLSASQLKDLIRSTADPSKIEMTLHQYMPLFHMEHCVFAAFMSEGSSFRDCGRPCESHRVQLRDAYGNTHFLKADQECRNTMFQGKAQSAALLVHELLDLGISHFRLELLDEKGEVFQKKVLNYFKLVSQRATAQEVVPALDLLERYGVNEGTLGMERRFSDRKKI